MNNEIPSSTLGSGGREDSQVTTGSHREYASNTQGEDNGFDKAENSGVGEDGESQSTRKESFEAKSEISEVEKREILDRYVQAGLQENMLIFNAMEIKDKYPKSYRKLVSYMEEKAHHEVDDGTVIATLLYTPRTIIYEFFDIAKIFVNIIGSENSWENIINSSVTEASFKTRVEAELDGFYRAFELLEKQ